VPAQVSPLKVDSDPVSAEHRARMVELAIAGNPAFALSRVDLDRPGPSYTVDTLRLLKAQYRPETELFFIVGEDSLETFMRWRSPGEILQLSRLVVVSRPGYDVDLDRLQARLPELGAALALPDTPEIMISSTEVRRRVREGWTIRYLVSEPVERYIREHDLYLNGGSDPPGDERLGERHGFRQRAG
jgi:nicotinate-nucleotide adenylyltransferase